AFRRLGGLVPRGRSQARHCADISQYWGAAEHLPKWKLRALTLRDQYILGEASSAPALSVFGNVPLSQSLEHLVRRPKRCGADSFSWGISGESGYFSFF